MKNVLIAGLVLLGVNSFASECKIYKYSSSYYVSIDGVDFTSGLSSFSAAVDAAQELNYYGTCSLPTPKSACKAYKYSDKYYISIDNVDITAALSGLDTVQNKLEEISSAGLCHYPQATLKCEVYPYSSKFYIKAGNVDVAGAFSSIKSAYSQIPALEAAGICYNPNGGVVVRHRDNDRGHDRRPSHRDRLGFDFKTRALQIATSTARVSKAIEPFINNEEERKVDQIKKQAIRLQARINAGASLKVVRNTLLQLGILLNDSSSFIEETLESDRLDAFAAEYLLAVESINVMVRFLDNEFEGERNELY